MNINEYRDCLKNIDYENPEYVKHNIQEILKRSVHTFKNFSVFNKSSDILQIYNINEFDKWVSSKSLVSQRNMYHQLYIALDYVPEVGINLPNDYSKHDLCEKICQKKDDIISKMQNTDDDNIDDTTYITILEDKIDDLESKMEKMRKLVNIFVYDKYRDVFKIVLNDN